MKSSCRNTLFTAVLAAFVLPPTLRAQAPENPAPVEPVTRSSANLQEIERKVLLKQYISVSEELVEAEMALRLATTPEQINMQQGARNQLQKYAVALKAQMAALGSDNNPKVDALTKKLEYAAALEAQMAALGSDNNPKVDALTKKLDAIRIPSVSFEDITISELFDFLRLRGKELDPEKTGVNLVLLDKDNKSTVTCNLQNVTLHTVLKIAAEQSSLTLEIGDEFVSLRKPTGKPTTPAWGDVRSDNNPKVDALTKKLDAIRIPSVSFEDITISELFDFLRFRGKELDPEKTGVNLVLLDKDNKSTVTCNLQNVTLHTVLKIAAEQSSLTLEIGDEFVSLRKPTGTQAAP